MSFVIRKGCSGCTTKYNCSKHQGLNGFKWSSCEDCKRCGSAPCTVCAVGHTGQCQCCGKKTFQYRKVERAIALERHEQEIQSQYRLATQSCDQCESGHCRQHMTMKYTDY